MRTLPNPLTGANRQDEEDHDGAVHREEGDIELRSHHAARHPDGHECAKDRPLRSRPPELEADQHGEQAPDHGHRHGEDQVLLADHLVIEAENVLAYKALRLMVMSVAHVCSPYY